MGIADEDIGLAPGIGLEGWHEMLAKLLLREHDTRHMGNGGPFLATLEPRRVDRAERSRIDEGLNLFQGIRSELLVALVEVDVHWGLITLVGYWHSITNEIE